MHSRGSTGPSAARGSHTADDLPAIHVRNLTVDFGRVRALDRIELDIDEGTFVAIIGPNGAGKSTLLSAIAGLVIPSQGHVLVHGRRPADRHDRIAYVMQASRTNQAVPLTVRETVRMGCYARRGAFRRLDRADRAAVEHALERMRITDLASRQLHELSGGQRQRTAVAQGLAQRADVLLLDEPITGLDLVTQEVITDVVAEERRAGRTVVVTTHDVGTARTADRVALVATRLVAYGPSATALTPANLSEAYGGHVHVLDDGTVILDDPHHHGAPDQLHG